MDKLLNDNVLYRIEEYKEWENIVNLLERKTNKFLEAGIQFHLFAIPYLEEETHYEYSKHNRMFFRVKVYCFKEISNKLELIEFINIRIKYYKTKRILRENELSGCVKRAYKILEKGFKYNRLYRKIYGE